MNQEAYIMAKKKLIISTSARKNSNSDICFTCKAYGI